MSDLPDGWNKTNIIDLIAEDGLFSDGDWIESKDQDPNGSIRLLQLADIGDGIFLDKSSRYVNETKFKLLNCEELFEGDVLVARMPDPLGRACLMPKLPQRCITVVDVAIIRPGEKSVSTNWLKHCLNSPEIRQTIELLSSGTTRKRISRGNLGQIILPVPPLDEQTRIADKLDTLLARVDSCQTHLSRVPQLLKRFRQSVLAAATSGRLTDAKINKWERTSLAKVCHSISDGNHQAPPKQKEGVPFITISDISDGHLDLSRATRFVSQDYYTQLQPERTAKLGDILFSVTGSIAIPILVNVDSPFIFQRHLGILKPNNSIIDSKYLKYALETADVKQQSLSVATGTAQLTIPLTGLRAIQIPLPSLPEQHEIVRRVEALFALADQLEARWRAAQGRVGALTPSLLAKAFKGELVPQDPNDEAAEKLLERILMERATQPDKPKREPKSKETREPTMTEDNVKEVIRNMPRDTFTFNELQQKLSGEYEQTKDIVFSLLNQKNPIIVQKFDSAAQLIHFIRRQE